MNYANLLKCFHLGPFESIYSDAYIQPLKSEQVFEDKNTGKRKI